VPADVLVIEDNEPDMDLVTFLLEEAGIDVRMATDAVGARRELARALPDLVLMDMSLGGSGGLDLVAEIRRNPATASLRIVALTAHAMRGDREYFLDRGCDGYIAKPIDVKTFAAEVRRLLPPQANREGQRP
jgi:CheY-like chemotaxis protein